jgi:hypothetical protein
MSGARPAAASLAAAVLFLGVKRPELDADQSPLYLVPRLSICEAIPPLPLLLHSIVLS